MIKMCYHIDITQDPAKHGGYVPSVIYSDKAGHYPLEGSGSMSQPWIWGDTLDKAQAICAKANERLGLTKEEAQDIVNKSITLSIRKDGLR
jgi:hypothetical protein